MKAQKIRKTFWIVSLVLGLAVAGIGARVVLAKPAEDKAGVARARAVMDEYKTKQPVKVLQASVKEEDLKKEILRPEWKGTPPYYPYAGPKIPVPVKEVPKEVVKEVGPTDLAAIGRVSMLLFTPPPAGEEIAKDTVVFWEFTADKKKMAFVPNEFITPKGGPERFRLVNVVRVMAGSSRFRLLYDVFDDPKDKTKVRSAELIYDGDPKAEEKDMKILPELRPKPAEAATTAAAGTKPAGGATTGATAATPAEPEAVATSSDATGWKPEIKTVNSGRRDVQFDEATFKHWKGKKIEEVLENVRTENYNKNGVQGVQIFPLDGNDMAAKFDIRRHDVLVSINGQSVKSKDDAIRIGRSIPQDTDRVTVVIDRDGRQITYNVDPRDPKARRSAAALVR